MTRPMRPSVLWGAYDVRSKRVCSTTLRWKLGDCIAATIKRYAGLPYHIRKAKPTEILGKLEECGIRIVPMVVHPQDCDTKAHVELEPPREPELLDFRGTP